MGREGRMRVSTRAGGLAWVARMLAILYLLISLPPLVIGGMLLLSAASTGKPGA